MICESREKAGCVVVNHGNVLIIKKDGNWQLPKGRIKNKEPIGKTAIRETIEETGIIPSLVQTKPFYTTNVVFFLAVGSGKPSSSKQENISDCRWVIFENAVRIIVPKHAQVLEHFSDYMQK